MGIINNLILSFVLKKVMVYCNRIDFRLWGDEMKRTGNIIALTNVRTEIEAELLQDILQQEGIAVLIKEHGSGG